MSYKCPIKGCKMEFRSKSGLELHNKVAHDSIVIEPKVIKEEKIEYDLISETSQKEFKEMHKKKRKNPIKLKEGQKLSYKQVMKILKHNPTVNLHNSKRHKPWVKKPLSEWVGSDKFTVKKVNIKKKGWVIYSIKSKRYLMSWVEGPIGDKYHIGYPTLVKN